MRRLLVLAVACGLSAASAAELPMKGGEVRLYPASGPLGMPLVPPIDDPAFQEEILAAHNRERTLLGIAPLVWSDDLAEDAEDWAEKLARANRMEHARQRRHGENLFFNGAGRRTPAQMVQGWTDEKLYYIPGGAHPNVSTTGDWRHVGHYTAVVWATTRAVGCAVKRSASSDFLVCRYDPPGNVRGYAAYDVEAAERVVAAAAGTPGARVAAAAARPGEPAAAPATALGTDPIPVPIPAPAAVRAPVELAAAPPPSAGTVLVAIVVPVVTAADPWPVPAAKPSVIAR